MKANSCSIILAFENLGLSKALAKHSTVTAMYLLDYILPQVAKLSRSLQTQHLDLSIVSTLVDATLNSLNDAVLPAANWVVLELLDIKEDLKAATEIEVTLAGISSFQEKVSKPFISLLKVKQI